MSRNPALKISESELQATLIEAAQRLGWKVVHFRAVRLPSGGWGVPYEGDAGGVPDLILAKGGRVILAELKAEGEYPTAKQREWLHELGPVGRVWRPSDIDSAITELRSVR